MCILLRFLLLNESLCHLGYGNVKYNFHNAKDSLSQFYLQVLLLLEVLLSVLDLLSDPGDRFIWFSSFEVWWYFAWLSL